MNQSQPEKKPSELFEGENSSLRKTFDELVHNHVFEHYTEDYYECACGKQVDASQMIVAEAASILEVAHIIKLAEEKTAGWEMKVENTVTNLILKARTAEQERVVGIVEGVRTANGKVTNEWHNGYNEAIDDITTLIRERNQG